MKDRIRQQMIKHPNHLLWDKDFIKWSNQDREDFEKLANIKTSYNEEKKYKGIQQDLNKLKALRWQDLHQCTTMHEG
jgi:hypothetical protein